MTGVCGPQAAQTGGFLRGRGISLVMRRYEMFCAPVGLGWV